MDDLVDFIKAQPAVALNPPSLRQRPNQLLQGVLAFLAVVGIGSAVTVMVRPPLRLRVITVEKQLPAAASPALVVPAPRPAARIAVASTLAPPRRDPRTATRHVESKHVESKPLLTSDDCKNDILCGLDDLKQ